MDSRNAAEWGISEAAELLPDVAAILFPLLELCSVEDWEYGDSLLLDLDPTLQAIEGEQ